MRRRFRRPLTSFVAVALLASALTWLAAPVPAAADPTLSGSITSNETWHDEDSPIVLTGSVQIEDGATLTVESGVTVKLPDEASITVVANEDAAIDAVGTAGDPIVFTSVDDTGGSGVPEDRWYQIYVGASTTPSRFVHTEIRWGGSGPGQPSGCYGWSLGESGFFDHGMLRYDDGSRLLVQRSKLQHSDQVAVSNKYRMESGFARFRRNEITNSPCGLHVRSGQFLANVLDDNIRDFVVARGDDPTDPFQFWLNRTHGQVSFNGDVGEDDTHFNSFNAAEDGIDNQPHVDPSAPQLIFGDQSLTYNWWAHEVPAEAPCMVAYKPWTSHPKVDRGGSTGACPALGSYWHSFGSDGYEQDVLPALASEPTGAALRTIESLGNAFWDAAYGDPVQTATGNYIENRTDLAVPEQVVLGDWTRTYNSTDDGSGLLGPGWSTTLDVSVDPDGTAGPSVDVDLRLADGRRARFENTASNVWTRPPAVFGDLVWVTNHYELHFVDGRVWMFDTSGRIVAADDWRGWTTSIDWSAFGSGAIKVTSDAGYGYDVALASGQITAVIPTFDADGPGGVSSPTQDTTRQVAYSYDTVGALEVLHQVTRGSGGGARVQWTYQTDSDDPEDGPLVPNTADQGKGLVTEVRDAEDRVVVLNQYDDADDFGRVTHQWAPSSAATGPEWSETAYSYKAEDPVTGVDLVTVITDVASGDEVSYYHDESGRLTGIRDPRGETLERSYDANGMPNFTLDRRGNTAVSVHDNDGHLTRRLDPDGSETGHTYDASGRLATITVHDGATMFVTTYGYEGAERIPTTITGPSQDGSPVTTNDVVGDRIELSTDPDGVVTDYVYDPVTRNLEQVVVDPDDAVDEPELHLVTEYGYDGAGRQDRVTVDPAGLDIDTVTTFDPITDQVATVTEEGEDPTVYEYNPDGTLDEVVDPTGAVTAYTYNARGGQETMTQEERIFEGGGPLGTPVEFTTTYGYNGSGEMDEVTRPGGLTAAGAPVSLSPVSTTTYDLGALARTASTTVDPTGLDRETVYAYDADGNQCRTTVDPSSGIGEGCEPDAVEGGELNRSTVTGFDEAGRATEVVDPLGHTVETVYNERGLVAQSTDASERVTASTYDAAGRQLETKVTVPGGSPVTVEARTYTPGGRLATVTSGSGGVATTTAYGYDDAGRQVTTTVDPGGAGLVTTTGFDAAGRPTSVTSPGGITSTTTYAFGAEQRTETTFTPGRGYTRAVFSERDEVISTQRTGVGGNPASPYSTVDYTYDDRGNLSAVTDANGNTVTYTTDGRGNRLTRTSTPDDHEVVETWAYNAADELIAETDGLERETTYEYNAGGQVASVMDPSGRETVFEYCEAGDAECAAGAVRRVSYHVWADTTPEPEEEPVATEVVAFGYDPAGRRTEAVVDPGGADDATVYTYGHVSGQVTGVDGPGDGDDYTVGYDTAGRRISLTGPDGVVVAYGYDDVGRLETVDRRPGTAGEVTVYSYDADGRLTGQALPEGQYRAWTYDPASGLLESFDQLVDGSRRTTNVAHDSLGRRWVDWTDGTVTAFAYDQADQLTGVHRSDSVFDTAVTGDDVTYLYDGVGNRTARIQGPPGDDDGDPEATDGSVEFYEYDDANQLTYVWSTVKDNVRFTYDPAGRRTAMGVDNDSPAGIDTGADRTDYTYDPAGRLDEVTTVEGDHNWVDTRGYDTDGNLIGMNVVESDVSGEDPVVVADHTFGYVWDTALAVPQPLQSTTDAPGVTATAVYTNGLGLVGGGTDRIGAEVTLATTPDPTVLTFTLATDVNGSTIPTPNTAGFARAHGYDEYGNPTGPTMGNPHEPALGYRGELQTADTVHLRARTYHPHTGTFTTPDPLDGINGTTTAANPYHYTNSDPVGSIDPLGLRPHDDALWNGSFENYMRAVQRRAVLEFAGGRRETLGALSEAIDFYRIPGMIDARLMLQACGGRDLGCLAAFDFNQSVQDFIADYPAVVPIYVAGIAARDAVLHDEWLWASVGVTALCTASFGLPCFIASGALLLAKMYADSERYGGFRTAVHTGDFWEDVTWDVVSTWVGMVPGAAGSGLSGALHGSVWGATRVTALERTLVFAIPAAFDTAAIAAAMADPSFAGPGLPRG